MAVYDPSGSGGAHNDVILRGKVSVRKMAKGSKGGKGAGRTKVTNSGVMPSGKKSSTGSGNC